MFIWFGQAEIRAMVERRVKKPSVRALSTLSPERSFGTGLYVEFAQKILPSGKHEAPALLRMAQCVKKSQPPPKSPYFCLELYP